MTAVVMWGALLAYASYDATTANGRSSVREFARATVAAYPTAQWFEGGPVIDLPQELAIYADRTLHPAPAPGELGVSADGRPRLLFIRADKALREPPGARRVDTLKFRRHTWAVWLIGDARGPLGA